MKLLKNAHRTIDSASQITWWLPESRGDSLKSRGDSNNHVVIVQNHVVIVQNHVVILPNHVVISKSPGKCPKSRGDFWKRKSRGDLHSDVIFIKEIY